KQPVPNSLRGCEIGGMQHKTSRTQTPVQGSAIFSSSYFERTSYTRFMDAHSSSSSLRFAPWIFCFRTTTAALHAQPPATAVQLPVGNWADGYRPGLLTCTDRI